MCIGHLYVLCKILCDFSPQPTLLRQFILLPTESAMERDRYMSPVEAQEFGILDKVLVHPPQDGEDEPELVHKEVPPTSAPSSSSAEP